MTSSVLPTSHEAPPYGSLVWAKFSTFHEWPSIVVDPSNVPRNVKKRRRTNRPILVYFFGTHDYAWVSSRQVSLYEVEFEDRRKASNGKQFLLALREAKRVSEGGPPPVATSAPSSPSDESDEKSDDEMSASEDSAISLEPSELEQTSSTRRGSSGKSDRGAMRAIRGPSPSTSPRILALSATHSAWKSRFVMNYRSSQHRVPFAQLHPKKRWLVQSVIDALAAR